MPFWVGGTGNITDAANHWAATTGGAPGAGNLPTSATSAIFDANSGANAVITVDGAFNCLDFDMSACAATPTLAGSATLNVSGSFKLKTGMTRTYTGAINFLATATGKTIQSNGVALASALVFNNSGGGWTLADALNTTGNLTFTASTFAGSFSSAGFSVNANSLVADAVGIVLAATLNFSGSTVTLTTNLSFSNNTSLTWTAPATLNCGGGGNFGSTPALNWNAVNMTALGASGPQPFSGTGTFASMSITTNASKTNGVLTLSTNLTITGAFKYLGNSVLNRLLLQSSVVGTPRTISAGSIDVASNFTDFMDITAAGVAAPFATGSSIGDCGGNTNITATTPATQTATGTASFTWSTHGWTSRVPLPQDDVVVNNAFIAGRTVTIDMPRLGKTIDFSGSTGAPIVTHALAVTFFGSFKKSANMTNTGSSSLTAGGRGSFVIQSNGVSWNGTLNIAAPSGTYSLSDAFTCTINNIAVSAGTFNDGGFSVTVFNFQSSSGATFTKSGNWTLVGLTWAGNAGTTINDSAGWIKFTDTSASTKTFTGGGKTYNQVWISGAGTGAYQFSGNNTFGTFTIDTPPHTVQFTAGSTTNIANWQGNGTPGNVNVIGSITAANHTLNFTQNPGHVDGDYLSISRSSATPANWWFAGSHSTDGGNNTGWVFADYVGMIANANVIASVAPQLTTGIILQASESVQTAWSGSLGTGIVCRTAMQANASITAPLTTAIPMAASLLDVATLAANLVGNNCEDFEVPTSPHVFAVPDQPHVFKA